MRQRAVHAELRKTSGAEKHFREQAERSNAARFIQGAVVESPKACLKVVTGNVPVAAEDAAGPLPEIGNDYNIGLVITGAGFEPCFPLAHVVGRSQICVPVTAPDLQAAKFVDQKEVGHAGNRVGAIHSRRAILQDVDVIDHREGNEVNVHASAEPDGVQRTKGDTFSVNEHQGFFGQQAAQVELDSTVTTNAVEVDGAASFLWQKRCQVGSVADAQFLDVCRTIRIHWIRARLFRGRDVRARHNNLLDGNARLTNWLWCRCDI